jgi:hypothetical protein
MQLCRIIYSSWSALHVSSNIFTHHQEHLHCIYSFWYYSRVLLSAAVMELTLSVPTQPWQQPTTTHVNNTRSCICSEDAPDDERKYCSKHVEHSRNNKLSTQFHLFGHFVTIIYLVSYLPKLLDLSSVLYYWHQYTNLSIYRLHVKIPFMSAIPLCYVLY